MGISSRPLLSLLLQLLILLPTVVESEIMTVEFELEANSMEVHGVKGFLYAPAHVDLSNLVFRSIEEPAFVHDDDIDDGSLDDDFVDDTIGEEDDDETPAKTTPPSGDGDQSTPAPTENATPVATASVASPAPSPSPVDDEATPAPGDAESETPTIPTEEPPEENNESTLAPGDDSESTSPTEAPSVLDRRLDDSNQVIDVVLVYLPGGCNKTDWGTCKWPAVGVGAEDSAMKGDFSFCCSADTAARDICPSGDIGKLIVDHSKFSGQHKTIDVPSEADQYLSLEEPMFEVDVTGSYVVVLANCNDNGLDVLVSGTMEWKSVGGFLPGDMFGLMFFYAGLTVYYFVTLVWYGCGMKVFQGSAIPIQRFIVATMMLGVLEFLMRTMDLYIWNMEGEREARVVYPSLVLGVLKRGVSRCLGVMVAMGWGVVRDSLGRTLCKIVFLGLVYIGLTLSRDFFLIWAENPVEKISPEGQEELLDLALILTPVVIMVNLIFYAWIFTSLNATAEYLRNMKQASKLRRHLRLRCILLFAFTLAAAWLGFNVADAYLNILTPDIVWVMEGAMHLNFAFVMTGVALLWRPNSNARDYAMQMELPALGGEENELELSCVVPSAGDSDDGHLPVDDGNFT